MTALAMQVPVLDLSRSDVSEADLSAELRAAFTSVGFLYLTGHGAEELQAQALAAAGQLFALPQDKKRALQATLSTKNRGWTPLGEETLDPGRQTCGDTKEGFYFGREVPADSAEASLPLHGPNVWPAEEQLPGFRRVTEAYIDACSALCRRLLRLVALSLGLEAEHFAEAFAQPQYFLRPLRYSAERSQPEEGLFGAGAHSDYGMLTLLATDGNAGLQIYPRGSAPSGGAAEAEEESRWVAVPPRPGAFIVNVGDMAELWTNGLFRSTRHRVVTTAGVERLSIPFFFEPAFDCRVHCLPTCCGEGNPARYAPVTAGEYLLGRYAQTHDAFKPAGSVAE